MALISIQYDTNTHEIPIVSVDGKLLPVLRRVKFDWKTNTDCQKYPTKIRIDSLNNVKDSPNYSYPSDAKPASIKSLRYKVFEE